MTETAITVTPVEGASGKSEPALAWIKINWDYFRTVPGILKIAQTIVGVMCMALASPAILSGTHWFLFVVIISFIATLIWISIYFLSIREALVLPINWVLSELLNTGLLTVLYVIGFIVQLSVWSTPYNSPYRFPNLVAGVFGLVNTLLYATGCYYLYNEWKSSKGTM